jgi:hypothetical protein
MTLIQANTFGWLKPEAAIRWFQLQISNREVIRNPAGSFWIGEEQKVSGLRDTAPSQRKQEKAEGLLEGRYGDPY